MEPTPVRKEQMHGQLVSQWITSLAISVVCCSVLFIVFAGYIVQLHEAVNLQSVRIEMLQDRQNHLEREVATLRRTPVVTLAPTPQHVPQEIPQPPQATSANGMELGVVEEIEVSLQKEMPKKEGLAAASATGNVALPKEALNPDIKPMMSSDAPKPAQ